MKQRYSDLSDELNGRQSMRSLVQTKSGSVQNFGERITTAAREAYPGQNLNDPTIQGHLVVILTSRLRSPGIMELILRKRPADLGRASVIGIREQQALKSYEFNRNFIREEDMDVDLITYKQSDLERQVSNLTQQMLKLTECIQQMAPVPWPPCITTWGLFSYTPESGPICYKCNKPGHIGWNCRQSNNSRTAGRMGQPLNYRGLITNNGWR